MENTLGESSGSYLILQALLVLFVNFLAVWVFENMTQKEANTLLIVPPLAVVAVLVTLLFRIKIRVRIRNIKMSEDRPRLTEYEWQFLIVNASEEELEILFGNKKSDRANIRAIKWKYKKRFEYVF